MWCLIRILNKIRFYVFPTKDVKMTQITLDDFNGGVFSFDLKDLTAIGYDESTSQIYIITNSGGRKNLPATEGDLLFLTMLAPFFIAKLRADSKKAQDLMLNLAGKFSAKKSTI